MAPSPFAVLLLSALRFQPGSPESSNVAAGRPPGILKRGRERLLAAEATCGHGSEVCAVDGSRWSRDAISGFAGRLPGGLRELRLDLSASKLDGACLGALAARLPGRLQLLELDLGDTSVGDHGLERLAGALPASLQRLGLDLDGTEVGDRGLERLAGNLSASLQQLDLDLPHTSVGDRGLECLAEALPLSLQHLGLDLRHTSVGNRGLERLAGALPASLQHLGLLLYNTDVGDSGLERLAEALPASLQHLGLNTDDVGDGGLERLAGALPASLQRLHLDLPYTDVGDRGLECLAGALPASLQRLWLNLLITSVGDRGLERLAEALPASLQDLGLSLFGTKVGDRGFGRLAGNLPASLQGLELDLTGTEVGDRGLGYLAALPTSLQHLGLDLTNTKVGDRGLEHLADILPSSLRHLHLRLASTTAGDRGMELLAEALPQQHLKDLAVDTRRSKVTLHSAEGLFKKLPAGLQKLSLNHVSCDGWHQAVETMQLSNKSPSDVWPQFWAAMHSGRFCAVFCILLAGTPDLKDPTTGMTALMLAARVGDIDMVRYLIGLGADVLDMDKLGRSARDFASASKIPALLRAVPEAPFSMVLVHMTQQMSFWIVTAACLVVAIVACVPMQFLDSEAGSAEDGPTGAVKLAAKATYTKPIVTFALATRLLEVISNVTGITMFMHRVRPAFALPVCLLLYGLPRLLRPRRGTLETPLGVELAVAHASLLDAASSRRNTTHGTSFALARLSLLFILASLSSLSQAPEWLLNGTGGAALDSLASNERIGVCLDDVAPAMRFAGWRPWNVDDDVGPSPVKPSGCIHMANTGSRQKYFPVHHSLLTSKIAKVNRTGTDFTFMMLGHSMIEYKDAVGVLPLGGWSFTLQPGTTVTVCPDSSACLATPCVHQLWSLLMKACQAAVLLGALASLVACALAARGANGSRQRRAEVFALARRIAEAGSAEEVGELRGSAGPVRPARALVLFPPGGIYFTLLLFFADVFLDGYTIYTMISNQDIFFAGVLLATTLFSTIREVRRGSLSSLRGWVAETLRTGIIADGLQGLLDNERGSEALISLLVSSYALPFTIKSPMEALLCPLSVLSSAFGLSSFLHEYLDLSLEEPGDEEENECTDDTESGEKSSDSSCTSSGSE